MKVIINKCYGGFSLSKKAYDFMGIPWDGYGFAAGISRHDPKLIEAVETLGEESYGSYARLEVVKIPDGVNYEISDYDGYEHVAESHRTWH